MGERSETVLCEETVCNLFYNLVSPFGPDHPFTCIPMDLTEECGKPEEDWPFVTETCESLFQKWRAEEGMPATTGRRGRSNAVEEDEEPRDRSRSPAPRAVRPAHSKAAKPAGKKAVPEEIAEEAPPGHPRCTSAEDCAGDDACRLVIHLLDGDLRDPYCEVCWASFLGQNKTLEGVWEDTDEMYEAAT